MEKHVNVFLLWEAFCSNLWSQSKAGSAQEQPAQTVVMVIRGKGPHVQTPKPKPAKEGSKQVPWRNER